VFIRSDYPVSSEKIGNVSRTDAFCFSSCTLYIHVDIIFILIFFKENTPFHLPAQFKGRILQLPFRIPRTFPIQARTTTAVLTKRLRLTPPNSRRGLRLFLLLSFPLLLSLRSRRIYTRTSRLGATTTSFLWISIVSIQRICSRHFRFRIA